jgi:hypothetical protein
MSSQQENPKQIPQGTVTPGVKCVFMICLLPFQMIWVLLSELFYRPVKVIKEQCERGDQITKILVGVLSPILYVFSMILSLIAAPTIICYNICAYLNETVFNVAIRKFFWYEGAHCVDYLCYGEAGGNEEKGRQENYEVQMQAQNNVNYQGVPVNQNAYNANANVNYNYPQPQYPQVVVQNPNVQNQPVRYRRGDNKLEAICYWIFCKK